MFDFRCDVEENAMMKGKMAKDGIISDLLTLASVILSLLSFHMENSHI